MERFSTFNFRTFRFFTYFWSDGLLVLGIKREEFETASCMINMKQSDLCEHFLVQMTKAEGEGAEWLRKQGKGTREKAIVTRHL